MSAALVFHSRPGFDALTGLPDRAAFLQDLRAAIAAPDGVAVLFLDLDDFKVVNDGFGHEAGDRLLIQVAARLKGAVHGGDTVARLGGDEFVVLCAGADQGGATIVAGRIRGALSEPFDVAGQRRHVRVSIGCRVAGPEETDPEALLRDADTAMYQAKESGKDRVELFSDATRARILRRIELEQALRQALEANELEVHYQPQIDLTQGRMVGVEALVRWSEASPAEFIPLAEETGLIGPLGTFVLQTATRAMATYGIPLTVNVSTRQLEDPDFPTIVAQAIADAGITPSDLCLEITESALMGAPAAVLDALQTIKEAGVYVGIDDFGTGHSSLSRLRELPVEVLKVDRSFIDGLGTEREDSAVVAAILSLAHALGLHVVAEGVETPLQADQLIALGCTVAQGWLWSPAVPAHELTTFSTAARPKVAQHQGQRSLVDEMMHQLGTERPMIAGLLALATGLAYTGLGIITVYELIRHRRTRGFSHFGLAFAVMAFTCGPHHLVHAYRHLIAGEPAHGPLTAALTLGLAPAVVFIGLRLEAAFGGRGDRLIARTPFWLTIVGPVMAAAAGATVWEAIRHAQEINAAALTPNAFLYVNYLLVGVFTARTQLARRPLLGGWSLSGVAMSGVFLTCAGSHLVAGMLAHGGTTGLILDNLGVPASFYFLWAVHRLHADSARDWNRRPLVGRSAPRGRRSPWATEAP